MSHKIDFSKGFAAFVSYKEMPWHGLGKVFDRELTRKEALAESGQDYTVEKYPNVHRLPNGEEIVSNDSFFTMRTDTNAVLGSRLGSDYTVYQNHLAFEIVDDILALGKTRIATAGAIDGGRRVFVVLELIDPMVVGKKDAIYRYIMIANSHDGTLAITAMQTNIRVVCHNTLSAALTAAKGAHKIRHTRNAQDRVKEAMVVMGMIEANTKANVAAYNAMRETSLTKQEFFNYIGNIFMTDEEIKKAQKGEADVLSTRKKNIITGVLDFSETGVGQREALLEGNGKLNGWYAYNAITGYYSRQKSFTKADDRMNSMLFGDVANKLKKAGDLILHPDKVQSIAAKPNLSGIFLN